MSIYKSEMALIRRRLHKHANHRNIDFDLAVEQVEKLWTSPLY